MSDNAEPQSGEGLHRIGRTLRGYNRNAVDRLLTRKENELLELRGQLKHQKLLLTQAQSERAAFMRSLEVAARAADELLDEATQEAIDIRESALGEAEETLTAARQHAEQTQGVASLAAREIVSVAKADIADYQRAEEERIRHDASEALDAAKRIEEDKEALTRYQAELSQYLFKLGQYLISASADPTIALPVSEQPTITQKPTTLSSQEMIDLADDADHDFSEFFSSDIDHDKSRQWILDNG